MEELEEGYSPYCPICQSCGEDGCCSALMCKMDFEKGHYCETYLEDLKTKAGAFQDIYQLVSKEGSKELKEKMETIWDEWLDKEY